MNVLGINSYNENSSAALIKNGDLCGFVQEERFSRIKNDNAFPQLSIQYLLKEHKLHPSDVNFHIGSLRGGRQKQYFLSTGSGKKKAFKFNGFHHQAHAASAYRLSPFKRANILVIDACGDNNDAITFFIGESDHIHKVWGIEATHISLGIIYKDATKKAGFGNNQEGKFMGLSSYGKSLRNYKDIFHIESHKKIRNSYADKYKDIRTKNDFYKMPQPEIINFSATIQKCLEVSVVNLIKEIYHSTKIGDFCFAGGVFLNSKLLGEINKLPFVKDIFVQPNAGDSGLAIGYALEMAALEGTRKKFHFDVYAGPSFSNAAIHAAAQRFPVKIKRIDDPAGTAAQLLKKNHFIGWFQGKMEWGPRALGNRSILANPCIKGNDKKLNDIKGREFWRPLAPTLLEELADEWIDHYKPSPYMMICFAAKSNMRRYGPAVVHVDGTARAQTLSFAQNPLYHTLIKDFYKKTGVPFVLNTSFNYQGEPIVCSPQDAIMDLIRMKLNFLIAGDYLITNR